MIGFPSDFLSLNLNFQNQDLSNNYAKGTTYGIRLLWRVLSLSSILPSFQMIKISQTWFCRGVHERAQKQGRTFHVVTASNSSGEAVVQYFSGQIDEQPDACGSFVRLTWDDNSKLAGICKDWGRVSGEYLVGKWGHGEDQNRLYWYPVFKRNMYHLRVQLHNVDDLKKMECDDGSGHNVDTNGDFWRVFVR